MRFKSFLRTVATVIPLALKPASATSEQEMEHLNNIGLQLAHPHLKPTHSTLGTQESCKDSPEAIINNVCLATNNRAIILATSKGFTCYSVETSDGKKRSICEKAKAKCHTNQVKTEQLNMIVEEHQVSIHSCHDQPPAHETRPNT